jgi:hypothetical protein
VGADRVLEDLLSREGVDVMSFFAEAREIFEWIQKHPIKESAPDKGKFWPQFVWAILGTLIVIVLAVLKMKQNQNLWSDVYYFFHFYSLASALVVTMILLGVPSLIGISLYRTNLSRPWRCFIGFSTPFFPAYLVRIIFFP